MSYCSSSVKYSNLLGIDDQFEVCAYVNVPQVFFCPFRYHALRAVTICYACPLLAGLSMLRAHSVGICNERLFG